MRILLFFLILFSFSCTNEIDDPHEFNSEEYALVETSLMQFLDPELNIVVKTIINNEITAEEWENLESAIVSGIEYKKAIRTHVPGDYVNATIEYIELLNHSIKVIHEYGIDRRSIEEYSKIFIDSYAIEGKSTLKSNCFVWCDEDYQDCHSGAIDSGVGVAVITITGGIWGGLYSLNGLVVLGGIAASPFAGGITYGISLRACKRNKSRCVERCKIITD